MDTGGEQTELEEQMRLGRSADGKRDKRTVDGGRRRAEKKLEPTPMEEGKWPTLDL